MPTFFNRQSEIKNRTTYGTTYGNRLGSPVVAPGLVARVRPVRAQRCARLLLRLRTARATRAVLAAGRVLVVGLAPRRRDGDRAHDRDQKPDSAKRHLKNPIAPPDSLMKKAEIYYRSGHWASRFVDIGLLCNSVTDVCMPGVSYRALSAVFNMLIY